MANPPGASKMSAWFNKHGPRVANSIHTMKQSIYMMLCINHIWNAARRGYIKSRKEDYIKYYSKSRSVQTQSLLANESFKSFSLDRTAKDTLLDLSKTIRHSSLINDRPLGRRSVKTELDRLLGDEFECPIPQFPRAMKIYRYFAAALFSYGTLKYAFLCTIYYGWIDIDKKYGCYLPGRVAFVPDASLARELPWVVLMFDIYHLVFWGMWYLLDGIEIDCLLFLCYDRDTVLDKQYQVIELNDPVITPPDVAYRKYLCNKMFYRRRTDNRGQVVYSIRHYRTVSHYEKMQKLNVKLRLFLIYVFYAGAFVLIIGATYTYFRHDYFDLSYPSCRQFSSTADNDDFEWSFSDKFRLWYLFADLLEGTVFIVDTAMTMSLATAAGILLTEDLHSRFTGLQIRTSKLNEQFRLALSNSDLAAAMSTPTVSHSAMKFIEDLHKESYWIFEETISTFEQIIHVDEYVRRYCAYVIWAWLLLYASYQASSILNLLPEGGVVTYFNTIAMAGVSLLIGTAFIFYARPYHRARQLYKELCIAMALCPTIPKSKIAWRWLLEFYKDHNVYSLHLMGKSSFPVTNLNILRCASWFVTCTVVLLSLLRY